MNQKTHARSLSFHPEDALAAEKQRTEEALEALYSGFVPTDGLGFGKRIGDGTHIAVERIADVAKQEMLIAKLRSIEEAEAAVEAGTYGFCEVCLEAIPEERLEARPYATRCVHHA